MVKKIIFDVEGVIYQEYIKTRVISFKFVNKYYYYTTLDSSQRPGTLLVKGKGLSRSRHTLPTHAPESGVLHDLSGMIHSLGKVCCLAFSLSCGTTIEKTDTPPAARNEGKIQLQHGSQEIWCQMGLVDRVGAFRTSTTPTSTKFVLLTILLVLPLYNQQVHARHNIVGTKKGRSCFG